MASFHAVASTSQAILGLLAEACPRDLFPSAQFALYQANDFKSPMDEGVSVYLYRLQVDASRNTPAPMRADGTRRRPPLPLALSYLITPWAKEAAQQQRLLGFCVQTLEATPSLPPGLLNVYSADPNTFGLQESVELILDPLTVQDLSNIWQALNPAMQVSAGYIARVVAIESLPIVSATPVQTRELDFAVPRP